jgi:predicted transcriptional regulator
MRILKFKTTEKNLNSTKIVKVANLNHSLFKGYKGYLFSQDEEDRVNDQYTVNVFFENEGEIVVTEYNSALLTDACRHFIKLNSHANCKDVNPGYNSDDPVNNRISAKLTFSFE